MGAAGAAGGGGCSVASIDAEYSKRLRSLLSVDDIVLALEKTLKEAGEFENTYMLFFSDHGYSQGQFRLCSHKMQVYDHGARVPALIRGPGIAPGMQLSAITAMADVAPTLIELAGGTAPLAMDGRSLAPLLLGKAASQARDFTLIEYESIQDASSAPALSAVDTVNNTFRSIRWINASLDKNLLYAEFADVLDPRGMQHYCMHVL